MSNKSFLHCSDHAEPLPHFAHDIDPSETVILCCDMCIPLLWFAMFTEDDIVTVQLESEDDDVETATYLVPVVKKEEAIKRLRESSSKLSGLINKSWNLDEHIEELIAYLNEKDGSYLCLDALEMFDMGCDFEKPFIESIRAVSNEDTNLIPSLIDSTTVISERSILLSPIEGTSELKNFEKEDYFNLFRTMGYGWYNFNYPWAWAS